MQRALKSLFLFLVVIYYQVTAFAYTATTGTGILKEVTQEQVSGDIGFMIIVIGLVLAGIVLITAKNFLLALIVFIGSVAIAMSPDLANGIIKQFGK